MLILKKSEERVAGDWYLPSLGFHLAAFGSHVDHHLQHFLLYFSHVFLLSCFRVGKDRKDTKEAGHPQRSAPLSRVKNRLWVCCSQNDI